MLCVTYRYFLIKFNKRVRKELLPLLFLKAPIPGNEIQQKRWKNSNDKKVEDVNTREREREREPILVLGVAYFLFSFYSFRARQKNVFLNCQIFLLRNQSKAPTRESEWPSKDVKLSKTNFVPGETKKGY